MPATGPAAGARVTHRSTPHYVPGELIVQFRRGVAATERARAVRRAGCVVEQSLSGIAGTAGRSTLLVRSSSLGTPALIKQFSADPSVALVAPNYIRRVDAAPLDEPALPQQWGLAACRRRRRLGDHDRLRRRRGRDIDTGVDLRHPDLAANMWHNPGEIAGNGIDDDGNGYVDDVYGIDAVNGDSDPYDDHGHGTHTSGTMAAVGDNGIGITGVGWQAPHHGAQVPGRRAAGGTDAGRASSASTTSCARSQPRRQRGGHQRLVGRRANNALLRDAINAAGDAGIVFCAAAGNCGVNDDLWPPLPLVLRLRQHPVVCASAGGRLAGSPTGAPHDGSRGAGQRILSTYTEEYVLRSGTSMATPFVTGTVALSPRATRENRRTSASSGSCRGREPRRGCRVSA